MKVKDLLGHYWHGGSNANLVIKTNSKTISELTALDVKNLKSENISPEAESIMKSTVCSFQIRDNVFTIHVLIRDKS